LSEDLFPITAEFNNYVLSLDKAVPDLSENPSSEHLVMQMIFFKFSRLSESLINLDKVSAISSFILLRSLYELTLDAYYLSECNIRELYDRFFGLGIVDSIKFQLCSLNIGIEGYMSFQDANQEFQKLEAFYNKNKFFIKTLDPKVHDRIENLFTIMKSEVMTPENFKTFTNRIFEALKKIQNWRPKKANGSIMGINDIFSQLESNLESNSIDEDIRKFGLRSFHDAIINYGNSAIHSSITHNFICLSRGKYDSHLDIQPGLIASNCLPITNILQFALFNVGLIEEKKHNALNEMYRAGTFKMENMPLLTGLFTE
jgi:hypothetical protein